MILLSISFAWYYCNNILTIISFLIIKFFVQCYLIKLLTPELFWKVTEQLTEIKQQSFISFPHDRIKNIPTETVFFIQTNAALSKVFHHFLLISRYLLFSVSLFFFHINGIQDCVITRKTNCQYEISSCFVNMTTLF